MGRRLRVGVLFGGRSGEHEVSLASAYSVMTHLDPAAFEVVPIGIDKQGRWLAGGAVWARLRAEAKVPLGPGEETGAVPRHPLPADADPAAPQALVPLDEGMIEATPAQALGSLDVVFPVLHGPFGEDGTVQGLLELADLPYVGSGVAGSAVAMDKILAKQVLRDAGLPIAPFVAALRSTWQREPERVADAVADLGYPCFVKPANLGSSVGITKVTQPDQLHDALAEAARYDRRLIIEAAVPQAREIEVSVLGNDRPEASVPGEIVPQREFYDYAAKYLEGSSKLLVPALLTDAQAAEVQRLAVAAFQALDLAGLARIDFLMERDSGRIWINEANTLPGFTPISMYPKLWAASGLDYRDLLSRLINLALERHEDRGRSATSL